MKQLSYNRFPCSVSQVNVLNQYKNIRSQMVFFNEMRLIIFQRGGRGLWKETFLPAPRKRM